MKRNIISSLLRGTARCPLLLAALVSVAIANQDNEEGESSTTLLASSYSRAASDVALEYYRIIPMVAEDDPDPLVRVYGDGRYVTHIPRYMKGAGRYEGRISLGQLNRLMASIEQRGLLDFNPRIVQAQIEQKELQRRRQAAAEGKTGELHVVTDKEGTRILVHLTDGGQRTTREIIWWGLRHDARRFPDIRVLDQLASLKVDLEALVDTPGLRRLDRE